MSILVIGDSFSEPNTTMTVWPALIAQRTARPVINRATGGQGYVAHPASPNRFLRQLHLQQDVIVNEVELVILFGSVNDRTVCNNDYYKSTVLTTHLEMLRLYPDAKKLVITPQWSGSQPKPAEIDFMHAQIAEAMWCYDWKYPFINPNPTTDYANWWFPPNMPQFWLPIDNFHPNQAGHTRMADKIEPHVRTLLGL